MNIHSDIPLSLSEINATWLTNVLRSEGVLQQEQVVSFTQNTIGAGFGFLGDVALLDLELSPADTEAPKSMVLKIPTASRSRAAGQILGAYEKEIRFYCDLSVLALDIFHQRAPWVAVHGRPGIFPGGTAREKKVGIHGPMGCGHPFHGNPGPPDPISGGRQVLWLALSPDSPVGMCDGFIGCGFLLCRAPGKRAHSAAGVF